MDTMVPPWSASQTRQPGLLFTSVQAILTFAFEYVEHAAISATGRATKGTAIHRRCAAHSGFVPFEHPHPPHSEGRPPQLHGRFRLSRRTSWGRHRGPTRRAAVGGHLSHLWHGASANQPSPRRERVGPEPEPLKAWSTRLLSRSGLRVGGMILVIHGQGLVEGVEPAVELVASPFDRVRSRLGPTAAAPFRLVT